ncbi:sigma-54 interaction domain-containing protein [Luteimonas deserti]|uniref:Sigma-54-dependent Fis family transcriptional regulator n=1 Tax=Luteimonas deserti TaxID=2752306 RepID=A0A7Z0TUM1_9GAMM|nr:sigma-54 dependent transcriptional regulator [Luteimonas deserti]NYZ61309.1 sigma-54-dependent Fis family transcriptional regulator [Luteimonas deserti]
MASVSAPTAQRCAIWFGAPTRREQAQLAAGGWHLRVAGPAHQVGMRGADLVVLVVDLRGADSAHLLEMQRTLAEHADLPSLAVVDDTDDASQDPLEQAVIAQCGRVLAAPLDAERLVSALAALVARPQRDIDSIGGRSPAILGVRAMLHRYAQVELPVLITGESGTGKELAAHALHALSARRARPFVAMNCGAIAPTLVQSELFGHERGAFTGATARRVGLFESADGGTVFLDEIGDLPLEAQTNLLRVLQEGTLERVGSHHAIRVDVRVLAATHVDLEAAIAQGRFRADLYYRLDVLRLRLPPLRERGDDIELLAREFLDAFRATHPVQARGFSAAARLCLRRHAWPGNVRELLNRVRRAAVVAEHALIEPEDLQLGPTSARVVALDDHRDRTDRDALLDALRATGGNVSACAQRLRISRMTVYRLCRKHGVSLDACRWE